MRLSRWWLAAVVALASAPATASATSASATSASATSASATSATSGPSAKADHAKAGIGELVRVSGSGWGTPGSGVVAVKICGNGALDPATDCDPSNTVEGAIGQGGAFYTAIRISRPPRSCPCILMATSDASRAEVRVPIEIAGVPVAPLEQPKGVRRAVSITSMGLKGDGPRRSWFGGSAERVLNVTVKNTGEVALHDPLIDITWGRGKNPDGFVAPPKLGTLLPGDTKVLRIPVHVPAWSFGYFTVKVEVDPFGTAAVKRVHTVLLPWGLIALALLATQVVLLAFRNRARLLLVPESELNPRIEKVLVWTDRRRSVRRAADRTAS